MRVCVCVCGVIGVLGYVGCVYVCVYARVRACANVCVFVLAYSVRVQFARSERSDDEHALLQPPCRPLAAGKARFVDDWV